MVTRDMHNMYNIWMECTQTNVYYMDGVHANKCILYGWSARKQMAKVDISRFEKVSSSPVL